MKRTRVQISPPLTIILLIKKINSIGKVSLNKGSDLIVKSNNYKANMIGSHPIVSIIFKLLVIKIIKESNCSRIERHVILSYHKHFNVTKISAM
jgi:hypothetical protein